jgi:MoaA/NifB/PqqE/SkfB family radical SAM enzyme
MGDHAEVSERQPAAANMLPAKFSDPFWTARGEARARVAPVGMKTLWFNTGTLCNLACIGCYIESSPLNDRLSYLEPDDVRQFIAEARREYPSICEIGFTGGEPFMNPDIIALLDLALSPGYRVLVLTNAMLPMRHHHEALLALHTKYAGSLSIRVSLDHYTREDHERIRGCKSWAPSIGGLQWLSQNGFDIAVAARQVGADDEDTLRSGFAKLFADQGIAIDAQNPQRLILFPEMDETIDVPEITEHCWVLLGKHPADIMCATSRMIVKRKGDERPLVVSCTLLPYDSRFEMGRSLSEANRPVSLNHPHCAKFCVLGGASCS